MSMNCILKMTHELYAEIWTVTERFPVMFIVICFVYEHFDELNIYGQ